MQSWTHELRFDRQVVMKEKKKSSLSIQNVSAEYIEGEVMHAIAETTKNKERNRR